MASKVEQVLHEALTMTPSEKAQVAHCLIASLDYAEEGEVEQEWIKLAIRRGEELDRGEVVALSLDELKRRVRER